MTMSAPAPFDFIRYLAAKQPLDDRSLNRHVRDTLAAAVLNRQDPAPLNVLEVGCGIGTMLARLLDWGLLTRAAYTGIDVDAALIGEARRRLRHYAGAPSPGQPDAGDGAAVLTPPGARVRVTFKTADLFDFARQESQARPWDLLIAHAVLDLVDLTAALPRLLNLLRPGGLFYFTLNFDGATIFTPPIDPDLDRRIEALYHRTMDTRRRQGQPAGSSRTGRLLLHHLREMGATVAAAGSSDWVVFPGPDGYPGDEAFFLHCIIDTIARALDRHPELDPARFADWLDRRRRQIDARELIYVAHQLDIMGYR
jgi:SAM-dependent methyltransferase